MANVLFGRKAPRNKAVAFDDGDLSDENKEDVPQQLKVCFNVCRKELYHPNKGYKQLARKLRQLYSSVDVNKEDITIDRLLPYDTVIFPLPQDLLTDEDLTVIKEYVTRGGSVMMLFEDGHEGKYSYLNKTLEEWTGTKLNEDCVVRTVMHKYLHPKEVAITNGVTNRALDNAAGKNAYSAPAQTSTFGNGPNGQMTGGLGRTGAMTTLNRTVAAAGGQTTVNPSMMQMMAQQQQDDEEEKRDGSSSSITFVYPHGLTLDVQRPGIPILSSGFMAYPLNRPIASVFESPDVASHNGRRKQGKLMLLGSALMFEDSWITKEENETLMTVLFTYLNHGIRLNQIDADEPDIMDYHHLPDTTSLSDRLRVAVEQQEELPRDFTKLFQLDTFKLDTDKIPDVIDAYDKLGVKLEPLTLIPPEFLTPLPPVKPAVFNAIHRDPAPPALDLFDLDEEFAPERVRLSQLTNKCKPEDVEFYILQAAEVMGVTKKLRSPRNRDPRALLDYVFRQVVQYKKVSTAPVESRSRAASTGFTPEPTAAADNAAAAAAAGNMVRVVQVNAASGSNPDKTPFDENPKWTLFLEADFGSGTINGYIRLLEDSARFPSQEARLQGDIKPPGEREYPMEWGVVLDNTNGGQTFYVFLAIIQGNQLRGVCEQGGGGSGNTQNFLYVMEEL